jgi:hypothetical protein
MEESLGSQFVRGIKHAFNPIDFIPLAGYVHLKSRIDLDPNCIAPGLYTQAVRGVQITELVGIAYIASKLF